ncbi:ABC transporter ATP-binding protein, partial [Clavibacter michiganensis]
LGGLLPALSGRVVAETALADGLGADPAAWRSRELAARIGTVFQDPEHQFLAGTVRAELEVGPRAVGMDPADAARRVDELLVRLRLDGLAQANPFTLSGGEKRRLSVATALATAPRLLVLDEPTFGQDARTWAELVALLADLVDRDGVGVLAVTHDADLVRALADDVLRLDAAPGRAARLEVVR